MIQPKVTCDLCGQVISKSNYKAHIRRHEQHPETFKLVYKPTHEGLACCFCGKTCKNSNSLVQHELRCKNNPEKIETEVSGFNKSGTREAWNKGLTKEVNDSIQQQANSLKEWYQDNPEHPQGGYIPTSARKCKYGTYKGFYCDSSWELAFVIYNLDRNISISRCTEHFEYNYSDKIRKYYPDFIIGDTYYEIKGIYRPEDQVKIEQFPTTKKLVVIDSKNIYTYVRYCELTYGKDFARLYDRKYPSWMDKHDVTKQYNFSVDDTRP